MLKTYVKYQGDLYPTEECEFFTDCVRHDNYYNGWTTMPTGTWEYVEVEITPHNITSKEYDKKREEERVEWVKNRDKNIKSYIDKQPKLHN